MAGWLHKYNAVRVPYIRDAACRKFMRDPGRPDCLRDLRVLDIGCGGGVLCEPMAQLGAIVVGVDPARTATGVAEGIGTAASHANSRYRLAPSRSALRWRPIAR